MKKIIAALALVILSMQVATVLGQSLKYPPLSEYVIPPGRRSCVSQECGAAEYLGPSNDQSSNHLGVQGSASG